VLQRNLVDASSMATICRATHDLQEHSDALGILSTNLERDELGRSLFLSARLAKVDWRLQIRINCDSGLCGI
jgi:hypothetical protein